MTSHGELISQLTIGVHPVDVGGYQPQARVLQGCIEESCHVKIKFSPNFGSADVNVSLDMEACDFVTADFDGRKGEIHLEGTSTLDNRAVRCIADIDLSTMDGTGYLILLEEWS